MKIGEPLSSTYMITETTNINGDNTTIAIAESTISKKRFNITYIYEPFVLISVLSRVLCTNSDTSQGSTIKDWSTTLSVV